MKLDDLIGLLFLIFFVVLPAVQGLMRRGPANRDLEPDDIPVPRPQAKSQTPPSSPGRAPSTTPPPTAANRPVGRPPTPKPLTTNKPVQQTLSDKRQKQDEKKGRTLEQIERERLNRTGSQPAQSPPQGRSAPPPAPAPAKPEAQNWGISSEPRAILNGVIWHQVLSEPRSKYWRNRRKPKP